MGRLDSRGGPVFDSVFPVLGVQFWSLVRELRSHMSSIEAKKKEID